VRNLRQPAEAKHCAAPATWLSDTRLVGDGLTRPALLMDLAASSEYHNQRDD